MFSVSGDECTHLASYNDVIGCGGVLFDGEHFYVLRIEIIIKCHRVIRNIGMRESGCDVEVWM